MFYLNWHDNDKNQVYNYNFTNNSCLKYKQPKNLACLIACMHITDYALVFKCNSGNFKYDMRL